MFALILLPLLAQAGPGARFEERALEGLRTTCGSVSKEYIIEVNGPGLGLGDFDGDGDPDLVVVDGSTLERIDGGEAGLPPRLFLNGGSADFSAAGGDWAMEGGRWGTGAATGDVDGDGHLDLLVLEWGPDRLFRNDAGTGFVERTHASGLAGERWGTSGAFLDADRDGDLDLAVVNYLAFDPREIASRASGACRWKGHAVMCGPEGLVPVHDQLYVNTGQGSFTDESVARGFRPERAAFGLGITTLDADRDGDTDLYVSNDSTPNHLWENDGAGRFAETGLRSGLALDASGREQAGMGIACGDVDDDGFPDLLVTNFSGESNALYLSSRSPNGRVRWRERAAPSGLGGPSLLRLGWGAAFADFDLDGDLDLAVANGHVYPQASAPGTDTAYAQPDELFLFGEDGRFVREELGIPARPTVSRALVAGDLDGDGWPDVVVADLDGPVRVLRNTGTRSGAGEWLAVRLEGRASNRDGLGALVTLRYSDRADEGGPVRTATREVRTAAGFQSASPARVSFGLLAGARPEELEIAWPSGRRTSLFAPALGVEHRIVEPEDSEEEDRARSQGGGGEGSR